MTPPAALRSSRPRAGATKAGNPTPQYAIMELKQRILVALSKLADRDTQQIAVEDLDKIVDTLSPDCVSVCLSCLYDSEMQQKSVVKKECVRLFGSVASTHGDLIIPHLSKIIGSILRRLRDPDSSVRDACVDAMGILSSRLISTSSSSLSLSPTQEVGLQSSSSSTSSPALTLATFSKPLLDGLSEQNKSVQTGAAMCLARVIESARDPPLGVISRLCPRICKFMGNPNFVARPALLSVIGSLSQVGVLGQGQLTMLMPCVHEALENNDWATRKAAADTLGCMSIHSGHTLASFRQSTLSNLESCRFDKVKPVRDSVLDAIQLWKSLSGNEIENFGLASKQDSPESNVTMEKQVSQTLSPTASEKSCGPVESPRSGNKGEVVTEVHPSRRAKFSPEKPLGIVKKRIPSLTDKKVNTDFFQKLSARNTDDWDIEVAVPCKSPSSFVGTSQVDAEVIDDRRDGLTDRSLSSEEQLFPGREMYNTGTGIVFNGEWEGSKKHSDRSPMLRDHSRQNFEVGHNLSPEKAADNQNWEACGRSRILLNDNGPQRNEVLNEMGTLQSLQRQLYQLEQQQSSLLQIVQDFIASSQEGMFALQGRVHLLEKVVGELACDSDFPAGWKSSGLKVQEMSGITNSDGNIMRSDFGNAWCDREPVSEHSNGRASGVQRSFNMAAADPASDDWNDYTFRNPRGGLAGPAMFSSGLCSQQRDNSETCELERNDSEDLGVEQTAIRRAWEKVGQPGLERRGEGPSARSVWQASKDEATLAAIRVAGEEKEASEMDGLSNEMSRLASESAVHTIDVQRKGQWTLWGSISEFVLSGDMESAYTEVLCMEDVRMLVRLMNRTGPVLDQVTDSTANELLHAVAHLLRQPSNFDISVAWIQQVADMVVSDGAESMDVSDDVKKELLLALQEMIGSSMLDDPSGTSLEPLFQLLMDAWSVNSEVSGTQL